MKIIQDFWNKRPCNIRHSNLKIGTKEYFDEVESKKYFVEPHIPSFADFKKWKNKKVLELGVGIGTDTINFLRAGADLTGIDISNKSLSVCRQRATVFGFNPLLIQGNIEKLERILNPKIKYDLIYSFGVIHHTQNPKKAIQSLSNFLKPNGELRIMLYSKYSFKLLNLMHEKKWDFSKCDEMIKYYAEAQLGCPYAHTYNFNEITDLLSDFKILDMHKAHIFPYQIEPYIKGKYIKLKALKNMTKEKFAELEKELGWHTLIRAKLKRKKTPAI